MRGVCQEMKTFRSDFNALGHYRCPVTPVCPVTVCSVTVCSVTVCLTGAVPQYRCPPTSWSSTHWGSSTWSPCQCVPSTRPSPGGSTTTCTASWSWTMGKGSHSAVDVISYNMYEYRTVQYDVQYIVQMCDSRIDCVYQCYNPGHSTMMFHDQSNYHVLKCSYWLEQYICCAV